MPARCRFSHPVALLPESALAVSGGGVVESLTSFGPDGVLCSSFLLHARARTLRFASPGRES